MTLLAFEGFDHVNTDSDFFAGILSFASATATSSISVGTNTQFGGRCLVLTTSASSGPSACYAAIDIAPRTNDIVVGTSVLLNNSMNTGHDIGIVNGHSCQMFCRFILDRMFIYRGDPTESPTLIQSVYTGLRSSRYAYLELRIRVDTGSSGLVELAIDGSQVASIASIDTSGDGTSVCTGVALGAYSLSGSFSAQFDDVYVLDSADSSPHNAPLGPSRVITDHATANVAVAFTPSSDTNWRQVMEGALDGDATYNESSTVSASDLFSTFALPTTTTKIFGVKVKAAARKDEAGTRSLATALSVESTTDFGSALSLSPSYRYVWTIYAASPHTLSPWTLSEVNALNFGYSIAS